MKIVIRTIKFLLDILPKSERLRLVGVSALLIVNSLLDLLGLGALLPVFSVLLEENVIEKHQWARWLYDLFSLTDERQLVVVLAIALLVIIIVKNLLCLWIAKINSTFALTLSRDFTLRLHALYYRKGFSYFKTTNSNVVVRNLRMATTQFSSTQVLGTLNLLNEIIVLTFIVVFIAVYNFKILILLGLTVLPPFYIFYRWVRKRSIELGNRSNKLGPMIGKNMFQSIFGYVDVVIMGAENDFRNKIKRNLNELVDVAIKSNIYNLAPTRVIESSLMLAITIMICFGIYYLPSKLDLIKLLGLFAVAGYRIMPSINRMMIAINGLNSSQWIFDVLEPLRQENSEINKFIDKPIEFNKELRLHNLNFSYSKDTAPIFTNYNLTIKKGEVIGFKGPSGAGKTTLMNILLGFLKPTSGDYFIDGVKLSEEHEASFYDKIGYVQQQVYLIDGSIAENVAFGCKKEEIDQDKLITVLKKANLWEMVSNLDNGLNEILGENGTRLSGGQRQRIGIARALYFDSEILFLDEATSALDNETEQEITKSIQDLSDGKLTIIIIAHRLSTLEQCDRIIEINSPASS